MQIFSNENFTFISFSGVETENERVTFKIEPIYNKDGFLIWHELGDNQKQNFCQGNLDEKLSLKQGFSFDISAINLNLHQLSVWPFVDAFGNSLKNNSSY